MMWVKEVKEDGFIYLTGMINAVEARSERSTLLMEGTAAARTGSSSRTTLPQLPNRRRPPSLKTRLGQCQWCSIQKGYFRIKITFLVGRLLT